MAAIIQYILMLAGQYPVISTICMVVGGLYALLTATRGLLYMIAHATKTDKDNKVLDVVFAFLDKFAYGFGKFEEYYNQHSPKKEEK